MSQTDGPEVAQRLEDLEVRVAYQDRLIDDLEGVVREFAARVEALESELKRLKETVDTSGLDVGPANDPPPHY